MDKARDQRLRRTYNLSLAEWEEMFEKQSRSCAICRKPEPPPDKRPFHTDHDHTFRYLTVAKERFVDDFTGAKMWRASIAALPGVTAVSFNRNVAIQSCRKQAKKKSVRGIICWKCNSGLKKFSDNFIHLRSASEYIQHHKEQAHAF